MMADAGEAEVIGAPVRMSISEPWEFETQVGTGALNGHVREISAEPRTSLVIDLDEPVTFRGRTFRTVIAAPRYTGDSVLDLQARRDLICTFVPLDAVDADRPFSHLIGGLHAANG